MANTERASTDSLDVSRGTEGGQGRAGQGAGSGIEGECGQLLGVAWQLKCSQLAWN